MLSNISANHLKLSSELKEEDGDEGLDDVDKLIKKAEHTINIMNKITAIESKIQMAPKT